MLFSISDKVMIESSFHRNNNTLFARYNNMLVDYWTPDNPTNAYPRPQANQERPEMLLQWSILMVVI